MRFRLNVDSCRTVESRETQFMLIRISTICVVSQNPHSPRERREREGEKGASNSPRLSAHLY